MDFQVFALRLQFTALSELRFSSMAADRVRGGLGAALYRAGDSGYHRLFNPRSAGTGPSGFANLPRPFVLRARHLDGRTVPAGSPFEIGAHLFDLRPGALDEFMSALAVWSPAAKFAGVMGGDAPLRLTLSPSAEVVTRVIVHFLSPTELKGAKDSNEIPSFGLLAARIRDRLSTLSALYGPGPLDIDFHGFAHRASQIRTGGGQIQQVAATRRSRSTGQIHTLGGFIGEVDYEGDLTEFWPYLEAAAFAGVGRQTVWGKGEIQAERVD